MQDEIERLKKEIAFGNKFLKRKNLPMDVRKQIRKQIRSHETFLAIQNAMRK